MSHDARSGSDPLQKASQQSQDAQRHNQDAAHHNFRKGSRRASGTQEDQQPRPQSNDGEVNQSEAGHQPEIPKVGSRDAPGG
jgi:hypothetical protein